MKKFACVWAAAAAMSLGLAACGGDDGDTPDAPPPIDAVQIDAVPVIDAITGDRNIPDFEQCVFNDDCENLNSDCRLVFWSGESGTKMCLPRCLDDAGVEDNSMCPFGFYCVPINGGNYTSNAAVMGGHCIYSFCGPMVENGVTGGACKVGGEMWPSTDGLADGWCYPISDGEYGQCLEAGTVAEGGQCDFDVPEQTRDGDNCDSTTLCIGQEGNPIGTCARICDPATIDNDPATNTGCPTGEDCYDSSAIITWDPASKARSTIGFCTDVMACQTLPANTCPNDPDTGDVQGCYPTNSLRPTGICIPEANGTVAVGDACPQNPTGDAQECVPGALCVGDSATTMSCTQMCDAAGTAINCADVDPTYTCQSILWDLGWDTDPAATDDDRYTEDWGICLPPAA